MYISNIILDRVYTHKNIPNTFVSSSIAVLIDVVSEVYSI